MAADAVSSMMTPRLGTDAARHDSTPPVYEVCE
jgi:hypothetical protein